MKRKLIRVLIALVALLVVATIAVRLFLPAEELERRVFAELEARTGLKAQAEDVSVSFPWPVGLKMREFEVATGEEGLDDGTRLELSAQELFVSADLMSLIRKSPQVNEARLVSLRAEVWMPDPPADAPGTGTGTPGGDATPGSGGNPPMALALGLLSVEDGAITVHMPEGKRLDVTGLDQTARLRLAEDGAVSGRIDSSLESLVWNDPSQPKPLELPPISVRLGVLGDLDEQELDLRIEELRAAGIEATGTLTLDASAGSPSGKLDLDAHASLADLYERFASSMPPPGDFDPQLQVESGTFDAHLTIDGELPGEGATAEDWISMLNLEGRVEGLELGALGVERLVSGSGDLALSKSRVNLSGLDLELAGIAATGGLSAPASGRGDLRGSLSLDVDVQPAMAELARLWPKLPEETRGGSSGPGEWASMVGSLKADLDLRLPAGKELDPALTPIMAEIAIQRLAVFQEGMNDSLRISGGRVTATMLKADLFELGIASRGYRGTVSGGISGWPESILCVGVLKFSELDLDALRETPEDEEHALLRMLLPELAHADDEEPLTVPPENLEARVALHADVVKVSGYALTEVTSRSFLKEQRMNLTSLRGKMGGGELSATGNVDWTVDPAKWTVDTDVRGVSAAVLFEPFAPKLGSALETGVSGKFHLEGPIGRDPEIVKNGLDGGGSLHSAAGALVTAVLLGDAMQSLPGDAAAKFQRIPFKSMSSDLELKLGKVSFDRLLLDGPTSVSANGWAALDGQVDYRLVVKLPAGEALDLGALTPMAEFLREADGRITVPVHVTGPGSKPKVQLELGAAERRAKEAARSALQDNLRNLLGGGEGGDAGEDSLKDKAADALNDLLKGFGNKKGGGG